MWSVETVDPEPYSGSEYVDEPSTLYVRNGKLHLRMLELPNYVQGARYKSARIRSLDSFTYGLFVVKTSHVPSGCGLWPAIWMFPPESKFGIWPNCGELDLMETVNQAYFMATSMNYGSCERGQNDWDSYCRHRSQTIWSKEGTYDSSIYAVEWTPDYVSFFHFWNGTKPSDIDGPSPNPSNWKSLGTFWRAGAARGEKPRIPSPPYNHSDIDGVAGFVCPLIQSGDPKENYDKRCVPGEAYCPGADTFQGVKGGGGCDFDAPFGPAVCDDYGMKFVLNVKACGKWPASMDDGTWCCEVDPQGAYSHLHGLDQMAMTIDSVRVYQRRMERERKVCCPYADLSPETLKASLDTICQMMECSPIRGGGLYSGWSSMEQAKWAFNQFYQRNHQQAASCADVCTSYITTGLSGCGNLKPRPPMTDCLGSSTPSEAIVE